MNHISEEGLLALRDGDDLAAADAGHLEGCVECQARYDDVEARARTVSAALEVLDESWDMDAARASVRSRVAAVTAARAADPASSVRPLAVPGGASSTVWRAPLARAAVIVLLLGGTASALPGSPVRDWLSTLLGGGLVVEEIPGAGVEGASAPSAAPAAADAQGTGIRLAAEAPLRISILGLGPDQDVIVRWITVDEVAVLAPAGSRFTSSDGRVEAVVSGGPVTVELPRTMTPATLEVGGRIYLRRSADGLEVQGPTVDRSDDRIFFRTR
ncbi:MAG: hypothetical protein RJQ04_02625 [Longimicrobiales bacterium]